MEQVPGAWTLVSRRVPPLPAPGMAPPHGDPRPAHTWQPGPVGSGKSVPHCHPILCWAPGLLWKRGHSLKGKVSKVSCRHVL